MEETPMHIPLDRVQMVWAEAQQLTRYLHALPPAAWHCPSACERWQVSDVVVHLATCAEFYAGSICRGLQGGTTRLPVPVRARFVLTGVAARHHKSEPPLATCRPAHTPPR